MIMRRLLALGGLALCWAGAGAPPTRGAELRAGRATVKLSPPPGLALGGDEKPVASDGTLDELSVKSLVLESGEARVVLAMCDLHSVDAALVAAVRKQLALPATTAVVIGATGSRSAPGLGGSPAWKGQVAARVVEAVRLASASMHPASLSVGAGTENSVAFYNRFLLRDGSVRANPGKLNPEVVQPAGEADAELTLVRVDAAGQQPFALLGSYALRPAVTGGTKYAADYPAAIAGLMSKLHGSDVVTMWSAASGANVSHLDVRSKTQQAGVAGARRVGTILAAEALKAEVRARPVPGQRILLARESVRLTPRDASHTCPAEAEVQAAGFGDELAIVTVPGELWSELGTAIRRASPFRHTVLVGPANAWAGVLPTRRGYSDGSLEWEVHCAAGSGEAVAEAAARVLAELRRSATIQ